MNDKINKGIFGATTTVFAYILGRIDIIVTILLILMIIDYFWGALAAWLEGNWNRKDGVKGLFKKIGYIICILLCFFIDLMVPYLTEKINLNLATNGLVGIVATTYYIGTELGSIFGHLKVFGVPIPTFIEDIPTKIKQGIETYFNKGREQQ